MLHSARTEASRQKFFFFMLAVLMFALFLRVHNALLFPPFIDEAHHIQWANDVYTLHPFTGATNGKLFGLWWMAAFGLYGDAALWLARVATGLFSLIGITALYRLGAVIASPLVGLLAALAYSLSPFAFFFDRMALLDSYVVVFGVLTAWFSVSYGLHGRRRDAVLSGLTLVGAIFAKATGVMLAPIPMLAIFLLARGWSWRKRLTGLLWSYGPVAAIWVPFYFFLRWRGYNYFSTATTVVGTSDTSDLLDRTLDNLRNALQLDQSYLGLFFMLLVLAGTVYLIVRRPRQGLFLALVALVPLAGLMAFATRLSTRYIQFHLPFLTLLAVFGLSILAMNISDTTLRRRVRLPLVVVLIWSVLQAAPFIASFWNDPLNITLPHMDFIEYYAGDSAGFGLPEIAAELTQSTQADDLPAQIVGLISNCEGLRRILPQRSHVTVICPYVTLDGSQQSNIAAQVNALAQQMPDAYSLWIALENQSPYFSLDGITAPIERLRVVERPGGLTQMSLYRVSQ